MTTNPSAQLEVIRKAVARHIANGLVSTIHVRASAARDLAHELDINGANVDNLVDQHLAEDGYNATKSNASWAPASDATVSIPEPIRRVLASHLADMLLERSEDEVMKWARGITFELKRDGLDLTADIEKRITALTLGPDPSDPPF